MNPLVFRRIVIIGAAIILPPLVQVLSVQIAEAQGFIIPTLGSRKNGTGTAVGRPDDLSAIYHNPGALTQLKGTRVGVSLGLVFLNTSFRLAPWKGNDRYLTEPVDSDGYYDGMEPGIIAPLPMISVSSNLWSDKLVGAFSIYVPNAAGASFGADKPTRYHIIDAYLISAFFTLAAAYQPLPWLSVGLGASVVYVRINRKSLLYPVINGTDFSALLGTSTEMELTGEDVRPAFNLGIQVWPHKTLSLGFMMLTRYDVALEGPLTLRPGKDASKLIDVPEFKDNEHRTDVVSPWVFAFGANWDITPWLELGAEFRYYVNSDVAEQRTTITKGPVLKDMLKEGLVTPKQYHDSYHTGTGFIIRPPLPINLEVMTGYHYEKSAAPNKTVEVSAPSFDIVSYHIGGRWRVNDRLDLSLHYTHYWYLERTTTDSITNPPTNFNGSAYSNMVSMALEWRFADGIGVEPKKPAAVTRP